MSLARALGYTGAKATVTPLTVGNGVAVTLLSEASSRSRAFVWNETGTLYVKFGLGATDSSYTWRLTGNTGLEIVEYRGVVTAIKGSGTTSVLVTDIS